MHVCSIHKMLQVVPGDMSDYSALAAYHYRTGRPVAVKAVYTLRPKRCRGAFGRGPAGVIVYTMPNPRLALRRIATAGAFRGFDRQTELKLLNHCVRCIARVIIAPRFRGIGLAVRLVRETMPRLEVPLVEALAVMPLVNPFLEKAGLRPFAPHVPAAHVELRAAFEAVGLTEQDLIDPALAQRRLKALALPAGDFVEARVRRFLRSHGTRRTMPPGLERTRYVLSRLAHRPAYYLWLHPRARQFLDPLGLQVPSCPKDRQDPRDSLDAGDAPGDALFDK